MLPNKTAIDLQNQIAPAPTPSGCASCIRRCVLLEHEQPDVDHLALDQLLSDYSLLVDDMNGINNYAGVALQLAVGCKNDSARWRSSFQTDDLLKSVFTDVASSGEPACQYFAETRVDEHHVSRLTSLLHKALLWEPTDQRSTPAITSCKTQSEKPRTLNIKTPNTNGSPGSLGLKRTTVRSSTDSSTTPDAKIVEPKLLHLEQPERSGNTFQFQTAGNLFRQNQSQGHRLATSGLSGTKRTLGGRRGPNSRFVLPVPSSDRNSDLVPSHCESAGADAIRNEQLKQFDQKIIELIMSEIMDSRSVVAWQDIAGLKLQKKALQEVVILPMLRPDLFTGLRGPPKGLLLFGPPGTGKTLIGKCIASQSKSTFFCISASSLTSKWVGEGEKMVRALFAIARVHQPAVIFIDEVDSLLTQRSETEHESSRRIKTEFLVQLDGVSTSDEERLLFVGATNRPQELDEAARRRFVKRLYIPLPDKSAREEIVRHLLRHQGHSLTPAEFALIASRTDGYSGADMANLCKEAAMGPIRSLSLEVLQSIQPDQVRPVEVADFEMALSQVRASVSPGDLEQYQKWNKQYGSFDV